MTKFQKYLLKDTKCRMFSSSLVKQNKTNELNEYRHDENNIFVITQHFGKLIEDCKLYKFSPEMVVMNKKIFHLAILNAHLNLSLLCEKVRSNY